MGHRTRLLLWGTIICLVIVAGAFLIYKLGASSPTSPTPLVNNPNTSQTCGTVPLDVVLVVDRSGSMIQDSTKSGNPPQTRLYYAKQAADSLVDQLNQNGGVGGRDHPLNEVGLVSFGGLDQTGVTVDVPLGNNDATAVKNAINNLVGNGGTPFKQAMAAAANEMNTHKRLLYNAKPVQHVIIFLSDGSPDPITNTPSPLEITNYLKSGDTMYSIAVGQGGTGAFGVDLNLMKQIAKPTPIKFHQVTTADQLPTLFNDIFTEIACKSADLALTKTVDNSAPKQNDTVSFTLTLTNNGPDSAEGITVKDVLPTGLTEQGTLPTGYDGTTWTVGTIASGAKVVLTLPTTVTAASGTVLTNVAEVMTSSVSDPNSTPGNGVTTENDYASVNITVAAAATTVTPPPPPVTPPVTPPAAPVTPPPTTPTAAPSSGIGGWGELLYVLIGLFVVSSAWLIALRLKQSGQ